MTTEVYAVIGAMAPNRLDEIGASTRLRDELMFDSLRLIELAMALEQHFGLPPLDMGESVDVVTAGDVADLVRRVKA
ncbi:acyl carrier protein [Actinoplanes sp. NPDC026619]|uniref:acyl carrier protein n=1 Tax=Actinoplanes sp. NPDC026619 TaxID=3155798 RepID=UPI003407B137